jgi:predicted small lipoprotein YifL
MPPPIRQASGPDYTRPMKTARLTLLLLSLVLLAACGNKGDLVLPDKADQPAPAENTEPPATP